MDPGRPISYEAVAEGTPVLSSSGTEFGTVRHVLKDESLDLFDGIVVHTHHGLRFVDRDHVGEMTTTFVKCELTDDQAAALPPPKESEVLHIDASADEGTSLSARFARMFGRLKWKELE